MKPLEVRIYFSWLLHQNIDVPMDEHLNDGSWRMEDEETSRQFAANYRREWAKYEDRILPALMEATGLEFYQPVIDVPCAYWLKPQSEPLVMSFRYLPDQFVDVLTHELIHVLLTDNKKFSTKSSAGGVDLIERWQKLFGKREFNTLVHIPVHALSKHIYLDVLKEPSRLQRDIEDVKENTPYAAAWEYVNSHDYRKIIADTKGDYSCIR